MDIPDRIIGDEVRLWRFRAEFLRPKPDQLNYQVVNPLPVTAAGKLVGFASVLPAEIGHATIYRADVAVEYGLPERLDVENGRKLYLLPVVRYPFGFAWVKGPDASARILSLQIRDDCTDPNQEHIGAPSL